MVLGSRGRAGTAIDGMTELPDRDLGNGDSSGRDDREGHGVGGSVTRAEKEQHVEEGR